MHKKIIITFILIIAAVFLSISCAGLTADAPVPDNRSEFTAIPLDPAVRSGVLENGLTWYVKENTEPEKRASLRLVINAGSVLEEDDQQGLAHFCEHMAFNGTGNFEKMEIVDYLESIGMAFGPDINAYTGFDETVYMLEIPTDDEQIVSTAFQVLEDWARLIAFEDEEVEKERGVIQEEWRLGRGAMGRIRDKLIPVLFRGSVYAERLPIGEMDIVMNAPPQRLKDFYESWYRPDLMAVVVVGDLDPGRAEELIREHFSFPEPADPAERPEYPVPMGGETEVLMISDPELAYSAVEINSKTPAPERSTENDYRNMLIESLTWSMFNDRLNEIARRPEAPFIGAGGGAGRIVRGAGNVSCYASSGNSSTAKALSALVTELERASRYGFSESEIERAKKAFLKMIEQYYIERENISSKSFASELVEYFLSGVFMPGPEVEFDLYNRFIPQISAAEINEYASEMLPRQGRVISIIYPESAEVPTEEEIREIAGSANSLELERWVDDSLDLELMDNEPERGEIVKETRFSGIDAELWHLSNGADVIIKATDFKEDEVLFSAFSRGGLSLVDDEAYVSGRYAPLLLSQSGLGEFNAVQLEKKLSGLSLKISPYIGDSYEGLSGSFSPDETEVFLQLAHLYFKEPIFNESAWANLTGRLGSLIENRDADPMNEYYDKITEVLTGDHYRSRPLDEERLASFNHEISEKIYSGRFGGADDFIFVFTGNVDTDNLRPLVETYIASLPAGIHDETPVDRGVRAREGSVSETVFRGIEEQSRVHLSFTGELEKWTPDAELQLSTAAAVIETMLREEIREASSGTYHISAAASVEREPYPSYQIHIDFGCEPGRVDELSREVLSVIERASEGKVEEKYIIKQEQQYRRAYEEDVKKNSFWLNHLRISFGYSDDPEDILTPEEFNEKISPGSVSETIKTYFDTEEYLKVILMPAD